MRGDKGGTLWRLLESKQHNPEFRTSVIPFNSQRQESLDSMSLSDSFKSPSKLSSVSDSKCVGYRGVVRKTGYLGLGSTSFKEQTTVMASKLSTSVCQKSGEAFESKSNSVETCSNKVERSQEENAIRQPHVQETVKTVCLNPFDVGFAGGLGDFISLVDGNIFGELMDECIQNIPQSMISFPLKVFRYQGKYFSEELLALWIIQSLNRLCNKFTIAGNVIPTPANIAAKKLRDSLKSVDRLGGIKWKNITTLNSLPTMKRKRLNLADIMYSTKTILDTYKGRSIVKELIEKYSSKTTIQELNVIEYNCKYYALENQKLWILKNAEVARGPLTVTGNVKISMDYIMFHSFTSDNIREVDIKMERAMHTVEERFMLEYIRRKKTP